MHMAPASETGASTKFRHVREKMLPARIARAIVACAGPRRQEKFTNGRDCPDQSNNPRCLKPPLPLHRRRQVPVSGSPYVLAGAIIP